MDLYFMFFRFGPAMKMIFELSYIPQKDDFKELTPDQYRAMYTKVADEDLKSLENQKVVAFLPDDPKMYSKVHALYGDNLLVVGSDEVATFAQVAEVIENYCRESGWEFKSMKDKLIYMAQVLPDVFSKETPYANYGVSRNLRKNKH